MNWNANIFQVQPLSPAGKTEQTNKQTDYTAMQRADKRASERERAKSFPSDDDADEASEVGQCEGSMDELQ